MRSLWSISHVITFVSDLTTDPRDFRHRGRSRFMYVVLEQPNLPSESHKSVCFRLNRCLNFYRATANMLSALYAVVRLSVRPSVCPSQGWISQKQLKLGCAFHLTVPHLSGFCGQASSRNSNFFSPSWSVKQGWGGWNKPCSSFMHQYLENGTRYHKSYY